MKLGNKIYLILILYFIFSNHSFAEEKITTTPLINIEEIKPTKLYYLMERALENDPKKRAFLYV